MSFLLNGKPVDALAIIVHRSAQDRVAREWVKKLRRFLNVVCVLIICSWFAARGKR